MGFELATLMLIGTDCIGSCKSNYYMITAPCSILKPFSKIFNERESIGDLLLMVDQWVSAWGTLSLLHQSHAQEKMMK
jgi:hypothetical protein